MKNSLSEITPQKTNFSNLFLMSAYTAKGEVVPADLDDKILHKVELTLDESTTCFSGYSIGKGSDRMKRETHDRKKCQKFVPDFPNLLQNIMKEGVFP